MHVQVLKDPGRRRQYDAARQAASSGPSQGGSGYSGGSGFGDNSGSGFGASSSGSGFQPGVENEAFEEAFRKWWEKSGGKCGLRPC